MAIEKMKSQSQLQQNLADLLSPLKSEAGSLAQALKGGVAASICLQRLGEGLTFIGGSPMAPANFRWPLDKPGHKMTFVAQLDFNSLPPLPSMPNEGFLLIFRAHNRATILPKERHSFNLAYLPEASRDKLQIHEGPILGEPNYLTGSATFTINPDANWLDGLIETHFKANPESKAKLLDGLCQWTRDFNQSAIPPGCHQMGGYKSGLNELKEMASFSASGITYSPERASDWHYKHLIEHCQDYKLFLNLDERVTGANSEESTVCILAKDEDIAIKSFEHAWLFCS